MQLWLGCDFSVFRPHTAGRGKTNAHTVHMWLHQIPNNFRNSYYLFPQVLLTHSTSLHHYSMCQTLFATNTYKIHVNAQTLRNLKCITQKC